MLIRFNMRRSVLYGLPKGHTDMYCKIDDANKEKGSYFEFGDTLQEKGLVNKLEVYAEDIQEDDSVLLLSTMNKNKRTLYQQYGK